MYTVMLTEINLARDRGTERQHWALSHSLSLFPGMTLDVLVVTFSLLCFEHARYRQEPGRGWEFSGVLKGICVQENQLFETTLF